MTRRTTVAISLVLIVLVAWGVYRLWSERFWPFATGTRDAAFLSTTFGMSPQEVRRTLSKHHAGLLTYDDYRRASGSPLIEVFGTLAIPEDRERQTSLYMPGIAMFDSNVEAEFEFRDERLRYVGVHFDPLSPMKAEALVASVDGMLRTTYQFSRREESQEVPAAYSLHFTSTAGKPSLWVNLTDHDKPIVLLSILSPTMQADEQREVEMRTRAAFGRK